MASPTPNERIATVEAEIKEIRRLIESEGRELRRRIDGHARTLYGAGGGGVEREVQHIMGVLKAFMEKTDEWCDKVTVMLVGDDGNSGAHAELNQIMAEMKEMRRAVQGLHDTVYGKDDKPGLEKQFISLRDEWARVKRYGKWFATSVGLLLIEAGRRFITWAFTRV